MRREKYKLYSFFLSLQSTQETLSKRNKEKIKHIDQQFQSLRPLVNMRNSIPMKSKPVTEPKKSSERPKLPNVKSDVATNLIKDLKL